MDFKYDILTADVYTGPSHKACRAAVLWPLLGSPAPKATGVLPEAYARLQASQRARMSQLYAAGWKPLQGKPPVEPDFKRDKLQLQYARNCPPFGVVPRVRSGEQAVRPCNRARICPQCYARRVVLAAYRAIEFACYHALGHDPQRRESLTLVGVRREFVDESVSLDATLVYAEKTNRFKIYNDFKTHKLPTLGTRSLINIMPGTGPGLWTTHRTAICIVPTGTPLPDALSNSTVRTMSVSKDNIAKLVAWCFRYPVSMMTADAKQTIELLEAAAQRRSRLVLSTGAVDNSAIRQAVHAVMPQEDYDEQAED